jgi:hypothetical protein
MINVHIQLHCDVLGCSNAYPVNGPVFQSSFTREELRSEAQRAGWVRAFRQNPLKGFYDRCPDCDRKVIEAIIANKPIDLTLGAPEASE